MRINIDELLEVVQQVQVDETQIDRLGKLLNERETRFEEESRQRQSNECFLNRVYCL